MPKRTPVYIDKERLMCYLFDIQLEISTFSGISHFPEEDLAKVIRCRDCKYEDPCGLPPDSESTFCRYSSHLLIQFPKRLLQLWNQKGWGRNKKHVSMQGMPEKQGLLQFPKRSSSILFRLKKHLPSLHSSGDKCQGSGKVLDICSKLSTLQRRKRDLEQ